MFKDHIFMVPNWYYQLLGSWVRIPLRALV